MSLKKVYCSDCHWFRNSPDGWCRDTCRHPENWIEVSTPRNTYRTEKEKFEEKNQYNFCPDYKPGFWIKLVERIKRLC